MSLPQTAAEWVQLNRTHSAAGPTENVVSTACPKCEIRFVLVGKLDADGWTLRCTKCGWTGEGELKT